MMTTATYNPAEELRIGYNVLQNASPTLRHAMVTIILKMADERKEKARWETDLDEIATYGADWDMQGAAKPNKTAVDNARGFFSTLNIKNLRLYATGLGAILFSIKTKETEIRGEIGDNTFTYYIDTEGKDTEYHNFEDWTDKNISALRNKILTMNGNE